jgi:hypothetical protein
MPETPESHKPPTADEIAKLADCGEDVSSFFNRKGKMKPQMQSATEEESNGQED